MRYCRVLGTKSMLFKSCVCSFSNTHTSYSMLVVKMVNLVSLYNRLFELVADNRFFILE